MNLHNPYNKTQCSDDLIYIMQLLIVGLAFLWSILPVPDSIVGSEASLTDNLKYFETIRKSDLSHSIVKRGIDPTR